MEAWHLCFVSSALFLVTYQIVKWSHGFIPESQIPASHEQIRCGHTRVTCPYTCSWLERHGSFHFQNRHTVFCFITIPSLLIPSHASIAIYHWTGTVTLTMSLFHVICMASKMIRFEGPSLTSHLWLRHLHKAVFFQTTGVYSVDSIYFVLTPNVPTLDMLVAYCSQ